MGHRRAPGEGQVNWSGPHNVYVAVLVTGKHPETGRNITRTRYASVRGRTRAAYADAERKLQELKDELTAVAVAEAEASDPSNYTLWRAFEDWYAWLPTTARTGQRTADNYYRTCRKWLKPRLGNLPLHEVTVENLSDMLEEVAPYLGTDALKDILGPVRRVIDYAMRRQSETGFAGPNPASSITTLPQAGRKPRAWDFLTQEQVEHVLDSCKGTRMHALMMLGFQLGMRPGEIRALQWADINFDRQILYVVRYLKGGERSSSRRGLPMSDQLAAALKAHLAAYQTSPWVFMREDGKQLDSDALSHRTGAVFKNAGMPHLTDAYVMRHTFASIMDHKGVRDQVIADLMGHANVTTFKAIYRHRLNPVVTEAADLMNDIWGAA